MFPSSVGLKEVRTQEAALGALCAALDPDTIPLPEVDRVWAALAAMERLIAGAKVRLARRLEDSTAWRRDGHRSPAEWLARHSGTSVGQARGALAASRQLTELPEVDDAVRRGRLSADQTEAVTGAASAAPHAQRRLVELAARRSLGELRDECARTRAAADRDAEERHRRIHQSRSCRRRATPDGAEEILYRSTGDEVAELWAIVQGYADREFQRARAEGRHEAANAYAADGLLAMARAAAAPAETATSQRTGSFADGLASGPPTGAAANSLKVAISAAAARRRPVPAKLIFRIDWDSFVRGWPIEGETCEIAGLGPVPVSLVRAMLGSGDVFLAAVVTRGVDVANVAHLGRRPTAYQRSALEWRDPLCDVEGCTNTRRLEIDHRADWAATKITALWALDRFCGHHHDLKTYRGWASVPGVGKRPMVPPGHADHPGTTPAAHQRPPPVTEPGDLGSQSPSDTSLFGGPDAA